jgi:hypothetical protein
MLLNIDRSDRAMDQGDGSIERKKERRIAYRSSTCKGRRMIIEGTAADDAASFLTTVSLRQICNLL